MSRPKQHLLSPPKPAVVILAWIMVFSIGSMDYLTGRDFAVSPYYLVPVCWIAWAVGRRAGIWLAVASSIVWFVSDRLTNYHYQHTLTPYWNAVMFLVLFLFVVNLISAFQAAHQNLEATVQQRTADLQAEIQERKRLEVAKIQAERLAMVGTMAAQVAHEVRNPLGSITLNLDLLQKEISREAGREVNPPGESGQFITEIRDEVQRIQKVLEEYLRFARLPKPQLRPVELNELLDQKLDFMNGTFERARVKRQTHFDPAVGTVQADAEQLWQATLNLIRNSLDAMPNGGELTVGTWREGGQVRLRVTDTGKGMSEEQLDQVFVPFFTTKHGGTGLGLALVQQIAGEHGGQLECESTQGKGTTFTLFLPAPEKKSHGKRA
ncbi:MAG TPA: ATP-binding protein [Verrucomicrobiae bacterium]|nr:ATP-binding protein [Verrucomicrobiae bacterium]